MPYSQTSAFLFENKEALNYLGICDCNVWGPGDGPLEMYFEKTRTRRRKREKDSERYSPESGHIRKRYGDWREYLVVR